MGPFEIPFADTRSLLADTLDDATYRGLTYKRQALLLPLGRDAGQFHQLSQFVVHGHTVLYSKDHSRHV